MSSVNSNFYPSVESCISKLEKWTPENADAALFYEALDEIRKSNLETCLRSRVKHLADTLLEKCSQYYAGENQFQGKRKRYGFNPHVEAGDILRVIQKILFGDSVWFKAIENGQIEVIQEFLAETNFDINKTDQNGNTGLILASRSGHEKVAAFLLECKGLDIEKQNKQGKTAFAEAVEAGDIGIARLLHKKGANVNVQSKDGSTPLMRACGYRFRGVTQWLLSLPEVDLEAKDQEGKTALIWALKESCFEDAAVLLQKKASVDTQDSNGNTPMMWAIKQGSLEIGRMLLENSLRPDLKKKNHAGDTALMFLLKSKSPFINQWVKLFFSTDGIDIGEDQENAQGCTLLMQAVEENHYGLVDILLKKGGGLLNRKNKAGKTALMIAFELELLHSGSRIDMIKQMLCCKDVDCNITDTLGSSLLIRLIQQEKYQLMLLLLETKGDDVEVNKKNCAGLTPLILAARKNSLEGVRILLSCKGIDANLATAAGETALVAAVRNRNPQIIKEILHTKSLDLGAHKQVYHALRLASSKLRGAGAPYQQEAILLIQTAAVQYVLALVVAENNTRNHIIANWKKNESFTELDFLTAYIVSGALGFEQQEMFDWWKTHGKLKKAFFLDLKAKVYAFFQAFSRELGLEDRGFYSVIAKVEDYLTKIAVVPNKEIFKMNNNEFFINFLTKQTWNHEQAKKIEQINVFEEIKAVRKAAGDLSKKKLPSDMNQEKFDSLLDSFFLNIKNRKAVVGTPKEQDIEALEVFYRQLEDKIAELIFSCRKPDGTYDESDSFVLLSNIVESTERCAGAWAGEIQRMYALLHTSSSAMTLQGMIYKEIAQKRTNLIHAWARAQIGEEADFSDRDDMEEEYEVHYYQAALFVLGKEFGIPGSDQITEHLKTLESDEVDDCRLYVYQRLAPKDLVVSVCKQMMQRQESKELVAEWMQENLLGDYGKHQIVKKAKHLLGFLVSMINDEKIDKDTAWTHFSAEAMKLDVAFTGHRQMLIKSAFDLPKEERTAHLAGAIENACADAERSEFLNVIYNENYEIRESLLSHMLIEMKVIS